MNLSPHQEKLLRRAVQHQKDNQRVSVYPTERNTFKALKNRGLMDEVGERTYFVTEAGLEWVDKQPKKRK